jgi:hypothetical protein
MENSAVLHQKGKYNQHEKYRNDHVAVIRSSGSAV